jgi:hypothetical protein
MGTCHVARVYEAILAVLTRTRRRNTAQSEFILWQSARCGTLLRVNACLTTSSNNSVLAPGEAQVQRRIIRIEGSAIYKIVSHVLALIHSDC